MSVDGGIMPQTATDQQVSWPYVMPQSGFLSAMEERQLGAIFAQIVPRDPARRIPGATDAGAARFVSLLLAMDAHVEIRPYDGPLPPFPASTELEQRVADLEVRLHHPGRHSGHHAGDGRGQRRSWRPPATAAGVLPGQGHLFYDPHGAPPFVGVEHDEDDGYRVNWNLGTGYDSNQYGRPVGDGKTPRGGRLRLDRRGPYFAAYYRNEVDAPDWVCVGVVRNDSLNPVVYLRCAGKRWRQEKEQNPAEFLPIVPNHIIFKNLTIQRFR